jgi:hypothetical protein
MPDQPEAGPWNVAAVFDRSRRYWQKQKLPNEAILLSAWSIMNQWLPQFCQISALKNEPIFPRSKPVSLGSKELSPHILGAGSAAVTKRRYRLDLSTVRTHSSPFQGVCLLKPQSIRRLRFPLSAFRFSLVTS